MFGCMSSGCPWRCGTRKLASCSDQLLTRGLAFLLWIVLLGSLISRRILNGLTSIGIGGSLAAPPLPHHRTCGSASGGSAG